MIEFQQAAEAFAGLDSPLFCGDGDDGIVPIRRSLLESTTGASARTIEPRVSTLPTLHVITKITSGGQSGADRAGLDVAIRHSFPHGGWCPKGRKAEDGPIGGQYPLVETPTANYLQRTGWNVRDSDGTVVFTLGPRATGGSLRTIEWAARSGKPCLHLAKRSGTCEDPAVILQRFITQHAIKVLNVAGSRESKEPGIYAWVTRVIEDAFFWSDNNPNCLGGPGEG